MNLKIITLSEKSQTTRECILYGFTCIKTLENAKWFIVTESGSVVWGGGGKEGVGVMNYKGA